MSNRVQTLRSSVSGSAPAAGTRQPGELWLNFADFALGFIDSAQAAQKLLGVRLFVTSANYAVGDFVVQGGNLYRAIAASSPGGFSAANWSKVGTAQDLASYLPLAGGTLTGALTLAADPTVALSAATKQYVDAGDTAVSAAATTGIAGANANANAKLPLVGGTLSGALNGTTATFSGVAAAADPPAADSSSKLVTTAWFASHIPGQQEGSNRIINGDMRIDQRNQGAAGTATGYTIDRWGFVGSVAKFAWQRGGPSAALASMTGFGYSLAFTSSSAYAAAASDSFQVYQAIEADFVTDFLWGATGAQPVILSFWATSSLTGTFSGAIKNAAATRTYPFTFSLPTANVWTKIAITIPGDTSGAWTLTGNAGAIVLNFDLGSGATYRGPANAWASTNYNGATGAVSVVGTNGATFYVTGVKLEIGSVATPFNRQSLAKSLADCQRYYQTGLDEFNGYAGVGSACSTQVSFNTTMRAAPTIVFADAFANGFGPTSIVGNMGATQTGFSAYRVGTITGFANFGDNWTANAEL